MPGRRGHRLRRPRDRTDRRRRRRPLFGRDRFPARATGLGDATARDRAVAAGVERLRTRVRVAADAAGVPGELARAGIAPSIAPADGGTLPLAAEHRRASNGDLWLLFNESAQERRARIRVAGGTVGAQWLDPDGGPATLVAPSEGGILEVALPPAGTAILWRPSGR